MEKPILVAGGFVLTTAQAHYINTLNTSKGLVINNLGGSFRSSNDSLQLYYDPSLPQALGIDAADSGNIRPITQPTQKNNLFGLPATK